MQRCCDITHTSHGNLAGQMTPDGCEVVGIRSCGAFIWLPWWKLLWGLSNLCLVHVQTTHLMSSIGSETNKMQK